MGSLPPPTRQPCTCQAGGPQTRPSCPPSPQKAEADLKAAGKSADEIEKFKTLFTEVCVWGLVRLLSLFGLSVLGGGMCGIGPAQNPAHSRHRHSRDSIAPQSQLAPPAPDNLHPPANPPSHPQCRGQIDSKQLRPFIRTQYMRTAFQVGEKGRGVRGGGSWVEEQGGRRETSQPAFLTTLSPS